MGLGLFVNSGGAKTPEEAWVYFIHGQSLALGNSPESNLPSPLSEPIPNSYIYYKPNLSTDDNTTFSLDNGSWQQLHFGVNNSLADWITMYGAELRLAYELQAYLKRKIYIVKFAIGDTALNKEGATDGSVANGGKLDWDYSSPNELYKRAVQDYWTPARNKLIQMGLKPVAKGLLWVQGERDAFFSSFASNHQSNLITLLSKFRAAYGNSNMHCAIARISNDTGITSRTYWQTIRTAQQNVAAMTNNSMIDEDPFTRQADHTHLAESGQLGYAAFLKFKDLK